MTGKNKRFPLTLSSVVDKPGATGRASAAKPANPVATPQTATQNAARHVAQHMVRQGSLPVTPTSNAPERSHPLVSDAVRRAMVMRVAQQGVKDEKVLGAMQVVPRHLFLDPGLSSQAYIDASLPIGHHQTISQPYIVARMIEVMRNGGELKRVLEIGTGCGYQAAVLSQVAQDVYSIERIKPLHELAKTNLRPLRIANIRLHYGDGMLGLPQAAPFDGIILAAAGMEVPQSLLEQMTIGGRLVAPVGGRHQVLQLIRRLGKYEWSSETLEDCHFVPLRPGTV
ncbi:MAG TPA: protein-L-isoaspartate(D-aspartate) O-methyltransferase [Burkholderiaceae bacterium]